MSSLLSDRTKYLLLKKVIDMGVDTCKIALMQSGFVYNQATHALYGDITASELPTANGYTVGGATLAGATITEDNTLHLGKCVWNTVTWTVSTANLVTSGAVIYDDTVAAPLKPIVAYIDFGSNQTTLVGGVFTILTPTVTITN